MDGVTRSFDGTDGIDDTSASELLAGETSAHEDIRLIYNALGGDDIFDGDLVLKWYDLQGGSGNNSISIADAIEGGHIETLDGNDNISVSGRAGYYVSSGDGNDNISVTSAGWSFILPGSGTNQVHGSQSLWEAYEGSINLSFSDLQSNGIYVMMGSDSTGWVYEKTSDPSDASPYNDTIISNAISYISLIEGTPQSDYFSFEEQAGRMTHLWGSPGGDTYVGSDMGGQMRSIGYNEDNGRFGTYTTGITVNVDGTINTQYGSTDTILSGIFFIGGSDFDDTFYASTNLTHFQGRDGNDNMIGKTGHEWFTPGPGSDTVNGWDGSATVNYAHWEMRDVDESSLGYNVDSTGVLVISDSGGELGRVYFDQASDSLYVEGFTDAADKDTLTNVDELWFNFQGASDRIEMKFDVDWTNKSLLSDPFIQITSADPANLDVASALTAMGYDPNEKTLESEVIGDDRVNEIDARGVLVRLKFMVKRVRM